MNMAAIGILLNISKGDYRSTALNSNEIVLRRRARRNVYGIREPHDNRAKNREELSSTL
jgi:hypothetical protein